jgi:REP element-mobilizing transposase RayT
MSRTRYRFGDNRQPHFLTCTVVAWLPIFTRPEAVQIVLDSWRFLQSENRITLLGYVILENHLHFIAAAEDLGKEVGDFKSYTAKKLIELLERQGAYTLLEALEYYKLRHKLDQRHQLWQEGSQPKQIKGDAMLLQKLAYMHDNPVKRGYVDDPLHWRYSSARSYARQPGLIDVCTDW